MLHTVSVDVKSLSIRSLQPAGAVRFGPAVFKPLQTRVLTLDTSILRSESRSSSDGLLIAVLVWQRERVLTHFMVHLHGMSIARDLD